MREADARDVDRLPRTVQEALAALSRRVRLLAAGGTISMQGEHAVPSLDAEELIAQLPQLAAVTELQAESVLALPGPQISYEQALELARHACAASAWGDGVVITTGTDTLEEIAVLCALLHVGDAPIVLTGANRPASRPGADGPANLLDAVVVAGSSACAGLGTVVVFGGEIHAAMSARKVDSTGPAAFGSPIAGPLGRIVDGRVWLHARPIRPRTLDVAHLGYRVDIVTAALGDDGSLLREAAGSANGIVVVAFGAGHLTPMMLRALKDAAERIPVIVTCRPERSSMMFSTYGFEGAERDVRATEAICAPFLSPVAARMVLLCCLGAGLGRAAIRAELGPWDAR
jgi:L-asparaginase